MQGEASLKAEGVFGVERLRDGARRRVQERDAEKYICIDGNYRAGGYMGSTMSCDSRKFSGVCMRSKNQDSQKNESRPVRGGQEHLNETV